MNFNQLSVRRSGLVTLAVVVALALVACGGDDDSENTGTQADQAPASVPTEGAEAEGAAGNQLSLAADPGGEPAFEPNRLTASAGEVTVDFTNESETGHNVVFERDGEDVAGTEVITASNASVTFDAEPGDYRFYCSVPGHADAGMEGTLTVE